MSEGSTGTFTFYLDGLGSPRTGAVVTRELWERLGVKATCDPAGGWVRIACSDSADGDGGCGAKSIDAKVMDRVAEVAARQGLQPRDRVGSAFVATCGAGEIRAKLRHEWASRLATGMVFGVPAIALHHLAPMIAPESRAIPGLIEMVLVGWSVLAACWPIVYQGVLGAAMARRVTPDVFGLVVIGVTFVGAVVRLVMAGRSTGGAESGMGFHLAAYGVIGLSFQRFVVWRWAERREGCAHLMMPSGWVLGMVLGAAAAVAGWFDFTGAAAMVLAMPACIGILSVNRIFPGPMAMAAPVCFAGFLGAGPMLLGDSVNQAWRAEAGVVFNMVYSLVLARAGPVAAVRSRGAERSGATE